MAQAVEVAKQWLEKWVGMPVDVDISSEFRYRALLLNEQVLTVSLSQSGETADTLAGIRLAKELGSKVVAISNVVGSIMSREADGVIYIPMPGRRSVSLPPRPSWPS